MFSHKLLSFLGSMHFLYTLGKLKKKTRFVYIEINKFYKLTNRLIESHSIPPDSTTIPLWWGLIPDEIHQELIFSVFLNVIFLPILFNFCNNFPRYGAIWIIFQTQLFMYGKNSQFCANLLTNIGVVVVLFMWATNLHIYQYKVEII